VFKYLPNLTASLVQDIEPWTVEVNRPSFPNKEAYRQWCNNPATDHAFLSAVEGQQPTLRISDVNPPMRMLGLILDYDAIPPGPPETLLLNNAPTNYRPAWVSRTFSGNCRVLYRFEQPIPIFNVNLGREFLKKCQRELKLRKLLPGFEHEALMDLSKYYEIGDTWTPVGDGNNLLPYTVLMAWLEDAANKHDWTDGVVIDIESLRIEGQKKYPDRWPGGWSEFDFGKRGPRFWDESAADDTAVVVRETGCQYYSDGGGFRSWESLFGTSFVKQYADDRKGAAIADLWHDGMNYWRKLIAGDWKPTTRSDIILDLHARKGLSPRSSKGAPSEIDLALSDIQQLKAVEAAMPFLYRPDGVLHYNGKRYLNVSTVRPIQPNIDACEGWGDGFPWLAQFLGSLFDPDDQLDYFNAWLKHFYMGAVTQNPSRGLALFIAGPAGAGKTILNKAILGQLMGGRQDAGAFLLNGDRFNDKLLSAALWNVDDEIAPTDARSRALFSQMVKKVVANDSITMRAMYRSGSDMEWIGRIVVTLNNDPESLQILPETEINILDKMMLLLTKLPQVDFWPSDAQIATELPYYGAFLRDWEVPDHLIPPPNRRRFGVVPYRHPELMQAAGTISETSSFEEVLDQWREEYFGAGGPGESDPHWIGNATQLYGDIQRNDALKDIMARNYRNGRSIGIHLNKLMKRGVGYISSPSHRHYQISRPTS
jgi:hypothetical protein